MPFSSQYPNGTVAMHCSHTSKVKRIRKSYSRKPRQVSTIFQRVRLIRHTSVTWTDHFANASFRQKNHSFSAPKMDHLTKCSTEPKASFINYSLAYCILFNVVAVVFNFFRKNLLSGILSKWWAWSSDECGQVMHLPKWRRLKRSEKFAFKGQKGDVALLTKWCVKVMLVWRSEAYFNSWYQKTIKNKNRFSC